MRKTFFSGALAALSLAITAPAAAQTQKLYTGIPGATGSADLVQQARRVLTTQSPALAQLTLAHVATFPTAHGQQVVKLRQTHMGLPVAARGASVVLDPSGKLQGFAASRVEQQLPSNATPALDASWAARQAGRLTGAPCGCRRRRSRRRLRSEAEEVRRLSETRPEEVIVQRKAARETGTGQNATTESLTLLAQVSDSIGQEINRPLSAIRNHAEAASKRLGAGRSHQPRNEAQAQSPAAKTT